MNRDTAKISRGFTLIELLVVIAIIALLLSIMMPSLQFVMMQAEGLSCTSNNRSLVQAWYAYQNENDGKLCGGNTYDDEQWLGPPRDESGNPSQQTLGDEIRGFEAGTLWPYLESEEIYHCPGDKYTKALEMGRGYRSTSIQGDMNGETGGVTKMGEITSPGVKYVFIENVDPRGWNMGSWIMSGAGSNNPSLIDPIAIFHADWSNLGFADGHAEKHRWISKGLRDWAHHATDIGTAGFSFTFTPSTDEEREDVNFLAKGYIPGRH